MSSLKRTDIERALFVVLAIVLLVVALWARWVNLAADIPLAQNADDLGDEGYWAQPARDLLLGVDSDSNFFQAWAGAPLSVYTLAVAGAVFGSTGYGELRSVSALYSSLLLVVGGFYFWKIRRNPWGAVVFTALYGLLPVTLFYSRIVHIEQHLLFYLFLGFILLERAERPATLLLAGFTAALAVPVKTVSVFVLPSFLLYALWRRRSVRDLALVCLGGLPALGVFAFHLWTRWSDFGPTIDVLASFHRNSGLFIDPFSIGYFWSANLVRPFLPWLGIALALAVAFRAIRSQVPAWSWLWLVTVFVLLSVFRYQSFARHQLIFFPLLIIVSALIGAFLHSLREGVPKTLAVTALAAGIAVGTGYTLFGIGSGPLFEPRYSQRDAAWELQRLSVPDNTIAGVHAHSLALYGRLKPYMRITSRYWNEIDPLHETKPDLALVASVYNGVPLEPRQFLRRAQLPRSVRLETFRYLDRFEVGLYRVLWDPPSRDIFHRFRQGRASRYDGVIYDLFRDDLEIGCFVKALQVAESRGDAEISHRKISTTGCAGMMGFCAATARDPMFSHVFTTLETIRPEDIDPAAFERDDRFDPEKSLRAAAVYARVLIERFEGLTDKYRLAAASYNGGPGFVSFLVRRSGKDDPEWERDIVPLLFAGRTFDYPLYGRWPLPEQRHKLRFEIPKYVEDADRVRRACRTGSVLSIEDELAP